MSGTKVTVNVAITSVSAAMPIVFPVIHLEAHQANLTEIQEDIWL